MQQVNDVLNQIAPYLAQVAPYLTFAVYVAMALVAIAFIAFVMRLLVGACNGLLKTSSRLVIFCAVLGLIYLGLDLATGGGNVRGFSFHDQPFWMIVAVILVLGIFFRLFATLRPTRDISC